MFNLQFENVKHHTTGKQCNQSQARSIECTACWQIYTVNSQYSWNSGWYFCYLVFWPKYMLKQHLSKYNGSWTILGVLFKTLCAHSSQQKYPQKYSRSVTFVGIFDAVY